MKKLILSWLLHHANRYYKNNFFYSLKSEILCRYGKHVGYDMQVIPGKKCYSCNGTGLYPKNYHGMWHKEQCWNCCGGWYRKPEYNILEVISFGRYIFHKPWKRCYEKPDLPVRNVIDGYVEHSSTYWSHFARIILFCIYRRRDYGANWDFGLGCYRTHWFKRFPKNLIMNISHVLIHGKNAYPLRKFKLQRAQPVVIDQDDLPF